MAHSPLTPAALLFALTLAACDGREAAPPETPPAPPPSPADASAYAPAEPDTAASAEAPRGALTLSARHDALGYPFSLVIDEGRALIISRRGQKALYLLSLEQSEREGLATFSVEVAPGVPAPLGAGRYALPLPEQRALLLLQHRAGVDEPLRADAPPAPLDGRPLDLLPVGGRLWVLLAEAPEHSLRALSPQTGEVIEAFDAGARPREIGRVYDTLFVTAAAPPPGVGQILLLPLEANGAPKRAPETLPTPVNPLSLLPDPRDAQRAWMTAEGKTALWRVDLAEPRLEPEPVEIGMLPSALLMRRDGLVALDARGQIARFTFEASGAATRVAKRDVAPGSVTLIEGDGVLFLLEPQALIALDPESLEERARLPMPSRTGRAELREADGAVIVTLPQHQEVAVVRWDPDAPLAPSSPVD